MTSVINDLTAARTSQCPLSDRVQQGLALVDQAFWLLYHADQRAWTPEQWSFYDGVKRELLGAYDAEKAHAAARLGVA